MTDLLSTNHTNPDDDQPATTGPEVVEVRDHDTSEPVDTVDDWDDDDADAGGVLVDAEVVAAPAVAVMSDRAILPAWLTSRAALAGAVRWAAGRAWRWSAFHTVRLPVYAALLVARSPIGAGRVLKALSAWTVDTAGADMRRALVQAVRDDARTADALAKVRAAHRRDTYARLALVVGVAPLWCLAWLLLVLSAPVVLLPVSFLVLGLAGRPRGASPLRIGGRMTTTSEVPRLTSELIVAALGGLGLGKMNTALRADDTTAVRFASPVTRSGAGWRVDLDLPIGVTAEEVIKRRSALASGLRRPLGCVWPECDDSVHQGRLVLYVSDQPLAATKPRRWPLADRGRVNLFNPIPLGVNVRGEPVTVDLMYASVVIGAVPRVGKTVSMRTLAAAASLDPRAELHIYDLKGGADFDPFAGPNAAKDPTQGVVHAYRSGDREDDIQAALADLRDLQDRMRRRSATLRSLPREVCPDSKVTDELASRPELDLHPILAFVDECQRWFEHPEHGKELEALSTDIVKRGPALGISGLFATQRPDASSLPPGIRDNAVLRLCLRVMSHTANDMVLGTGMHAAGHTATMFGKKDKGIGILVGEGDDPAIIRTDYLDGPATAKVVARARAMRHKAGLLTGLSAGHTDTLVEGAENVLDHLAQVWPQGDDRVWCSTLAHRLADAHPAIYHGWTGEQVTSGVKPHGLATVQVKRDGKNRKGLLHADLLAALANRDAAHADDADDDESDGGAE